MMERSPLSWRQLTFATATSLVFLLANIENAKAQSSGEGYYGKYIGKLRTLYHDVAGDVYAVDSRTLHIRGFTYDGAGPDAFFYAGNSKNPSGSGFRIRDERGTLDVLNPYRSKHVTLTLPEGKTLNEIKWFSVWCRAFSVNFGDIKIPRNLDFPKPQKIDRLAGEHAVASDSIVVVDAQTFLIPDFSYDGQAPDAKFWVGRGSRPDPQGVRVPDENGEEKPLKRYDKKTIVLTLPGDLTVFDIDYLSVWCEAFTVDFGHVKIPKGLNVPPSLKMLGVAPQRTGGRPHSRPRDETLSPFAAGEPDPSSASRRSYQKPLHNLNIPNIQPTTYRPTNQFFFGSSQTVNDQPQPLPQDSSSAFFYQQPNSNAGPQQNYQGNVNFNQGNVQQFTAPIVEFNDGASKNSGLGSSQFQASQSAPVQSRVNQDGSAQQGQTGYSRFTLKTSGGSSQSYVVYS